MAKLKFDSDVFQRKLHATYGVSYWLFHEPGNEPGVRVPTNFKAIKGAQHLYQQACFAGFLHAVADSRTKKKVDGKRQPYNRIAYKPKNRVGKQEAEKWIALCVKHRLLPRYIEPAHLNSSFVLKFGSTKESVTSPSLIYVYLTTLRHLDEYPDLVRITLHLVEQHDVDFFAALLIGSHFGCGNSNHNYIDYSWRYSLGYEAYNPKPAVGSTRISLRLVIALKRFLASPRTYDDRVCCRTSAWEVFNRINRAAGDLPQMIVRAEDLKHEQVEAIMNAATDEEIKEHWKIYEAEKKKKKKEETKRVKKAVPAGAVPAVKVIEKKVPRLKGDRARLPKRIITKRKA